MDCERKWCLVSSHHIWGWRSIYIVMYGKDGFIPSSFQSLQLSSVFIHTYSWRSHTCAVTHKSAEKLMVDFKILMLFNALGNVVQWSCHAGSASYQTGALGMFSKWYFYLVLAGGLRATSVQCIWPWCWGLHQHKNCHFQSQPNQKLQWEDLSSPDFFRVMC